MDLLLSNFYTYDWIIFALGAVNLIVFFVAMRRARKLVESVAPRINVSSGNADEAIRLAKEGSSYYSLYAKWQKAEFSYNLFCNLTSIFTLLGILGTVLSLIHLVDSTADINMEFLGALTSTMWGIIFTIVFKVLDTAISFDLDLGERISELVQMREYEDKKEPQPEKEAHAEKEAAGVKPDGYRSRAAEEPVDLEDFDYNQERPQARRTYGQSSQANRIPAPSERYGTSSADSASNAQKRGGWKK